MPEYLALGVFVEETCYRPKAIERVSTSTTALVGPTQQSPVGSAPKVVTSFAEFEQAYGGLEDLRIGGIETPNYLAHAVRAFFVEGGQRLCVVRVAGPDDDRPLTVEDYVGQDGPTETGLGALDEYDDVSIVVAPGASADEVLGRGVMLALVRHVERHRYRFAVLDSIRGQSVDAVRVLRREFDSSRAALYYPWVLIDNPLADRRRR